MFLRELIETTVKPIMQNGRKVYKHDYSDSVFPSEKVARDDERMKNDDVKKDPIKRTTGVAKHHARILTGYMNTRRKKKQTWGRGGGKKKKIHRKV